MEGLIGFGSQTWLCEATKPRGAGWSQKGAVQDKTDYSVLSDNPGEVVHIQAGDNQDLGDYEWARFNASLTSPAGYQDLWQSYQAWCEGVREVYAKLRSGGNGDSWKAMGEPWKGHPWVDIGMEAGFTASLQNFQSVRVTVGLEVRTSDAAMVPQFVMRWILSRLLAEENECKAQRQTQRKIIDYRGNGKPMTFQATMARVSLLYGVTIKANGGFRRIDVGNARVCRVEEIDKTADNLGEEFKAKVSQMMR